MLRIFLLSRLSGPCLVIPYFCFAAEVLSITKSHNNPDTLI
jgi:hypothetical protein